MCRSVTSETLLCNGVVLSGGGSLGGSGSNRSRVVFRSRVTIISGMLSLGLDPIFGFPLCLPEPRLDLQVFCMSGH